MNKFKQLIESEYSLWGLGGGSSPHRADSLYRKEEENKRKDETYRKHASSNVSPEALDELLDRHSSIVHNAILSNPSVQPRHIDRIVGKLGRITRLGPVDREDHEILSTLRSLSMHGHPLLTQKHLSRMLDSEDPEIHENIQKYQQRTDEVDKKIIPQSNYFKDVCRISRRNPDSVTDDEIMTMAKYGSPHLIDKTLSGSDFYDHHELAKTLVERKNRHINSMVLNHHHYLNLYDKGDKQSLLDKILTDTPDVKVTYGVGDQNISPEDMHKLVVAIPSSHKYITEPNNSNSRYLLSKTIEHIKNTWHPKSEHSEIMDNISKITPSDTKLNESEDNILNKNTSVSEINKLATNHDNKTAKKLYKSMISMYSRGEKLSNHQLNALANLPDELHHVEQGSIDSSIGEYVYHTPVALEHILGSTRKLDKPVLTKLIDRHAVPLEDYDECSDGSAHLFRGLAMQHNLEKEHISKLVDKFKSISDAMNTLDNSTNDLGFDNEKFDGALHLSRHPNMSKEDGLKLKSHVVNTIAKDKECQGIKQNIISTLNKRFG